ncbi:unnamed protein product [Phytomonas sp. EM1]|nr:unnamed protein product [Phytomonas sp. EM1]|eukprot:CCW60911.1 unnamed protein product [Phytomonas sp. isolate EM1]
MVGPSSASPRPPLGRAGLTPSLPKQREQKAVKQELKRRRVEEDIRKGDEFVGRGAGDIKSGNIEPFAYVPLNRTYMNRRNTRQALHRFEVIQGRSLKGEKAKAVYKAPKSK